MTLPVLHQTDLFHPHNDPDDHWDLACVYALALAGEIHLKGLVIDYPPADQPGAPDALGIAQMNYLTGLRAPFSVGSSIPLAARSDTQPKAPGGAGNGVRMVIDVLEKSPHPVVITIAGSCRDIAIAGNRAPGLFKEQCAGLYLNAGTGSRAGDRHAEREYNVRLDPAAYAAIFDLPCPVYWMPCFEVVAGTWQVRAFGTWYRFLQADILPHLGDQVQKYFAYMFSKSQNLNWLDYLRAEKDQAVLAHHAQQHRNMWCTGGLFHAAGKTVTADGRIVPRGEAARDAVFTFDPIDIQCDEDGMTHWSPTEAATNRFIFHVRDVDRYAAAMTTAMGTLLCTLP